MEIKGIIDEDFINYRVPSMVVEFPHCNFKCDKECGRQVCQNSELAAAPAIDIYAEEIVDRYLNDDITSALVCQGLEPFDSWEDLLLLCTIFRLYTSDPIVIYTGYNENEIKNKVDILQKWIYNFIIKYGRYIPDQESHLEPLLGVELASPNQYAVYYR